MSILRNEITNNWLTEYKTNNISHLNFALYNSSCRHDKNNMELILSAASREMPSWTDSGAGTGMSGE